MSVSSGFTEEPDFSELDGIYQELKADTGFSTYAEYLKTQSIKYPRVMYSRYVAALHIYIMDIPKAGGTPIKRLDMSFGPTPRREDSIAASMSFHKASALRLFRAIKLPIEGDNIRIVVWYVEGSKPASPWVDIIGLGLKIPASFFTALEHIDHTWNASHLRFPNPQHLIIGGDIATFLPGDELNNSTIVIVHVSDSEDPENFEHLDAEVELRNFVWGTSKREESEKHTLPCKRHFDHYHRLFSDILILHADSISDNKRLFYASLLPLFKIRSIDLQMEYERAGRALLELREEQDDLDQEQSETYEDVDQWRFRLRRKIEDFENAQQSYVNYVTLNDDIEWLHGRSHQMTTAYCSHVTTIARRLEAEIRDYMQLVIGSLSINESRKSIELSNASIQEGKKGLFLQPRNDYQS